MSPHHRQSAKVAGDCLMIVAGIMAAIFWARDYQHGFTLVALILFVAYCLSSWEHR